MRNVCTNEWNIFREFFRYSGQDEIYHYLESLCDHLYDSLRPRILHEPKLEVLCELCNVLQALISLDGDAEDDEEEAGQNDEAGSGETSMVARNKYLDNTITEDSSFDITLPNIEDTGDDLPGRGGRLRFSELLNTVLQDAQTRLVFRAQSVMEAEVLNYVPKADDLDYPAILKPEVQDGVKGKGKERMSLANWQKENGGANAMGVVEEDGVIVFRTPPDEVMETWYPTLRKTLWVLSRLHSYVNVSTSLIIASRPSI